MSKPSKPPEERINITYRPATGDHPEGVELPAKFLMIGDYGLPPTLDEDGNPLPLEDQHVIDVNKKNLPDVLRDQQITLDFQVPNHLSKQPGLPISLTIDEMSAFSPEKIVRQVPELDELLTLRESLTALLRPMEKKKRLSELIKAFLTDPKLRAELETELGIQRQSADHDLGAIQ